MEAAVLALLLLLAAGLAVAVAYNKLVTRRLRIDESWANVDAELKRRHDLVPNLVATVKGYAAHERALFERLAALRAEALADPADTPHRQRVEQDLARGMARLVAVAEANPELRASANFLHLQRALVETEDRIQAARRFYNANVRDYNDMVRQFPSNFVAQAFKFAPHAYFELSAVAQREAPDVRT